jgi:hypothetical protein
VNSGQWTVNSEQWTVGSGQWEFAPGWRGLGGEGTSLGTCGEIVGFGADEVVGFCLLPGRLFAFGRKLSSNVLIHGYLFGGMY